MDIIDAFSEKSICIRAEIGKHLNLGLEATAFLCQSLYWTKIKEKEGESWFYKSHVDWEDEILLSRQRQRTAREKLKELGILEEEVRGSPPKVYYKINKEILRELLSGDPLCLNQPINNPVSTNQLYDSNQSIGQNQPINNPVSTNLYKEHRLHTENTTETTTYIKNIKKIPSTSLATKNRTDEAQEVFIHWKTIHNHPMSQPDQKRLKLIKARLAEGYTAADLKKAIEGCKRTPWNMGHNDGGKIYDSIELICRSADKVDMFMANYDKPPIPKDKATLESEKAIIGYTARQIQRELGQNGDIRH